MIGRGPSGFAAFKRAVPTLVGAALLFGCSGGTATDQGSDARALAAEADRIDRETTNAADATAAADIAAATPANDAVATNASE